MADHKPESVSPSSLIQVGGINFANMRSVEALQAAEASAPAFHRAALDALKRSGKVRGDEIPQRESVQLPKPRRLKFGVGAIARTSSGKKVTIIQANAGVTKKSKTPVHKVANKRGEVWLEKETEMTLLL